MDQSNVHMEVARRVLAGEPHPADDSDVTYYESHCPGCGDLVLTEEPGCEAYCSYCRRENFRV